jgi:methionyl-tRNA formyltransferase
MRLIFAGTPAFAAEALAALHAAGHEIVLVLTTPDKRAGRGMQLTPSATAELAAALRLRVEKPANLKDPAVQLMLSTAKADAMVVAAYGQLLPQAVLDIPRLGCLNIHGSLLPRWRGAAPVQRAIAAGDAETGISIMQMDAGLDTGAVLLTAAMPILPDDTSASLFAKLAHLGATMIVAALEQLPNLRPQPQPVEGVSYAQKIKKAEARIDWTRPAVELERKLRAFDPFPGAEALFAENILKIWRADVIDNLAAQPSTLPGRVIGISENAVCVQCGRGVLALKIVQKPAGRRQPIGEFLRHTNIQPGAMFT